MAKTTINSDWKSLRKLAEEDVHWRYVYSITHEMMRDWIRVFARYRDILQKVSLDTVAEGIETGYPNNLIYRLDFYRAGTAASEGYRTLVANIFERAGKAAAGRLVRSFRKAEDTKLDTAEIAIRFDLRNPFAEAYIATATAELVTLIDDETKKGVRAAVLDAFQNGIPPKKLARVIRSMIGLTARDAQAVSRYYISLVQEGALPQTQIDKLVAQYAAKKLMERATLIARTETIRAAAAGTQESWRQADQRGLLLSGTKREWIAATEDPRTCPVCRELDGQKVGLHEPFVTRAGQSYLLPPAHPYCRCAVALVSLSI